MLKMGTQCLKTPVKLLVPASSITCHLLKMSQVNLWVTLQVVIHWMTLNIRIYA